MSAPSLSPLIETLVPPEPEESEVYLFPCTVAQKAFWLLDQMQPGNPAGNIPIRFEVSGLLDAEFLRTAFEALIARHEALRTGIRVPDDSPVQVVFPAAPFDLQVHSLEHLAGPAQQSEAEQQAREEATNPFDMSQPPLLRARLLRLGARRHILLITLHHVISDGWSTGVVLNELSSHYASLAAGLPCPVEAPELQFGDYATWEGQHLASDAFRDQLRFWQGTLAGAAPVAFPPDRAVSLRTFDGEIVSEVLPRELTDTLVRWGNGERQTLFVTFLTALKVLLAHSAGQTDVTVGTLLAGRDQVELEPTIGLYVNSLPLRTDLSGDPPFSEVAGRVRQTVLDAFEHKDVPFESLLEELSLPHQAGSNPLFRTNFIYQRAFLKPQQCGGLEILPIPSVTPGAIHDQTWFLVEREEGWRVSIEYNPVMYEAQSVRRHLADFLHLVQTISFDANIRISAWAASRAPASEAARPDAHAEPRTETERKLAAIWQEVLQKGPVSVDANFFSLGGHSLQAARIVLRIEKRFGRRVPLARMIEAPTIASMAKLIESDRVDLETSCLVALRREGYRKPVFIVHGVGGNVVGFEGLVRHLPAAQPVFALQATSAAGGAARVQTVTELAAKYLREIQKVQTRGPYHLLGYSAGGLICFEMAQQLKAAGHHVGLLGMLDTVQLAAVQRQHVAGPAAKGSANWAGRIGEVLRRAIQEPDRKAYVLEKVHSRLSRVIYPLHRKLGRPVPQWISSAWDLNWYAIRNYEPAPYDGSVVLFRAGEQRENTNLPDDLGWKGLAREGVEIIPVLGDHRRMLEEPNVAVLARELTAALERTAGGRK